MCEYLVHLVIVVSPVSVVYILILNCTARIPRPSLRKIPTPATLNFKPCMIVKAPIFKTTRQVNPLGAGAEMRVKTSPARKARICFRGFSV